MKKVIGGALVGFIIGFISASKGLGLVIEEGCTRGPIIHEDDDTIIKQCKKSNGELVPIAWVINKKSEK